MSHHQKSENQQILSSSILYDPDWDQTKGPRTLDEHGTIKAFPKIDVNQF